MDMLYCNYPKMTEPFSEEVKNNNEIDNLQWDKLIQEVKDIDRFIGAQIRSREYFTDQSILLSKEDLYQVATFSLFESFRKRESEDPEWTSFKNRFMEKQKIGNDQFEKNKTKIFLGWAKTRIGWAILDEAQNALGEAHTKERRGNLLTLEESSLQTDDKEEERKDRDFFDTIAVSYDVYPEELSEQTLENFEHFFGISTGGTTDPDKNAQKIRQVFFQTVKDVIIERGNSSSRGAKPGNIEMWAFEAYFIEQKPLSIKAQETGAKLNSLSHAIPRIGEFLYMNREEIRKRVKENISKIENN